MWFLVKRGLIEGEMSYLFQYSDGGGNQEEGNLRT